MNPTTNPKLALLALLLACSSSPICSAKSQQPLSSQQQFTDFGGQFVKIDESEFLAAEKEAKKSLAFVKKQGQRLPSISWGSTGYQGSRRVGVYFDHAVDYPDLVPGLLLKCTMTFEDKSTLVAYYKSKAALDSFLEDDKKVVTPYVFMPVTSLINTIDVEALTLAQNGSRTRYSGQVK